MTTAGPRRPRWSSPATSTTPTPPSWRAPAAWTRRVHQLTVSPLHNQAPHPIRVGFRIGWSRSARRWTARLARLVKAEPTALEWEKQAGPFFGNQIGELVLDGRDARFLLSVSEIGDTSPAAGARRAAVRTPERLGR